METFLNRPWPYLASAAFAGLILLYISRRPHRPGVRWFGWLMSVYVIWALAGALSTVAHSLPVLYGLFVLQSVCALVVTGLQLLVALEYTGSEKWITWRLLLLLSVPPLILTVIAFLFPQLTASIEVHSGVAFLVGQSAVKWIFYAYASIVFLICVVMLLTCLMRAPAFWAPILLIIMGSILPVIGFAVIRPEWVTVPPIQVSILVTNITMLTYFVALYSFHIMQVIPVARDMLVAWMPYGLIVLDSENHIVDFNAAALALPGLPSRLVLQRAASQALGSWWDRLAPLIGPQSTSQDFTVQNELGARVFHVTSLALLQVSGWRLGQVFLMQDVTEARQTQQQQEQRQSSLAAQQERERLARELHDSLGQTLAATHLQASTARLYLSEGQIAETARCLEQITDIALAAEVDVREYLLGARTAFSPDHHFFEALRRYVVQFSQQYSLPVELTIPPQLDGHGLLAATEVQLMRIIQEALSNVRKHAHAHSIQVCFTDLGSQLQVTVTDDGQGFDPRVIKDVRSGGFGLQSMRERVEGLGGCLELNSQPGRGTQVMIQVPAQEPERRGEAMT